MGMKEERWKNKEVIGVGWKKPLKHYLVLEVKSLDEEASGMPMLDIMVQDRVAKFVGKVGSYPTGESTLVAMLMI